MMIAPKALMPNPIEYSKTRKTDDQDDDIEAICLVA